MPVLNEAGYIENAVNTVLSQDYDGDQELILALGPSTDATDEIVAQLAARDPRIVCVRNPNTDIPFGLNLAIKSGEKPGDRAGGRPLRTRTRIHHACRADPSTHRRGQRGRADEGAGVRPGSRPPPPGRTTAGSVSAAPRTTMAPRKARRSPPTSGCSAARCSPRSNYYDESLRRGEDWELNLRIRAAGHQVWFDPALVVTYWPRESWTKLVRQFIATGAWRGELVRRYAARNPWRFFAPPVLVVAVLLSIVAIVLQLTGVLSGWLALLAWLVYAGPIAYLIFLIVVALVADRSASWRDRLLFLLVLPTMHLSWGLGFLIGVVRGAHDVSDTSRTDI